MNRLRPLVPGTAALFAGLVALGLALAIGPGAEVRGVAIEPVPDAFGEVLPGLSMEVVPGRPGINRVVAFTSEALVAGVPGLELVLDQVDTGTTIRVPLVMPAMTGMDHSDPAGMREMVEANPDGLIEWTADALVLPAGSRWEANVRILSAEGTELARQSFAFTMGSETIEEGRGSSSLDPLMGVALALLLIGAVGFGLGAVVVTRRRS